MENIKKLFSFLMAIVLFFNLNIVSFADSGTFADNNTLIDSPIAQTYHLSDSGCQAVGVSSSNKKWFVKDSKTNTYTVTSKENAIKNYLSSLGIYGDSTFIDNISSAIIGELATLKQHIVTDDNANIVGYTYDDLTGCVYASSLNNYDLSNDGRNSVYNFYITNKDIYDAWDYIVLRPMNINIPDGYDSKTLFETLDVVLSWDGYISDNPKSVRGIEGDFYCYATGSLSSDTSFKNGQSVSWKLPYQYNLVFNSVSALGNAYYYSSGRLQGGSNHGFSEFSLGNINSTTTFNYATRTKTLMGKKAFKVFRNKNVKNKYTTAEGVIPVKMAYSKTYYDYSTTNNNKSSVTSDSFNNVTNNYSNVYNTYSNDYSTDVTNNTKEYYQSDPTYEVVDNDDGTTTITNTETNETYNYTYVTNNYGIDEDALEKLIQDIIIENNITVVVPDNDDDSGSGSSDDSGSGSSDDSGSGSSDDSGSGSSDDSGSGSSGSNIWERLANAIADFLDAIGKIIGGIISGIIEMITNILNQLQGLLDLFGDFPDFLAQVFTFLPTETITILGLAISIGVVGGLIKFLRG